MTQEDYSKLSKADKALMTEWYELTAQVFTVLTESGQPDRVALKTMRKVLTGKNIKLLRR